MDAQRIQPRLGKAGAKEIKMSIKQLTFAEAKNLISNDEAENFPYPTLSGQGQKAVKEFADSFYEGESYNLYAVMAHCEQDAADLLCGRDHIVEFKRHNNGMFGGFVVQTIRMDPADFDWFIND